MQIDQLRAFLAVMDHGSMLVAADALGQPRSTLRAKVEGLEEALGVPLFHRTRAGTAPTSAATALAPEARAILNRLDALPAAVRDASDDAVGSIHIRAPIGMPPALNALFVLEANRRHPNLRIRASFADDPLARLPDDVDLVIHFGPSLPRGPYRTSVVARVPEQLLASRSYLAERGRPQSVSDLAHHNLLSWQPPGETGQLWPTREGPMLHIEPMLVCPDIHQVRTLVVMGMGIALLPNAVVPTTIEDEDLEVVLPDQIGREAVVRLVVPEARATHPRVRVAVGLIQEIAAGTLGLEIATPSVA
jgi:DNA-binding transcriptional LysR family regulator